MCARKSRRPVRQVTRPPRRGFRYTNRNGKC
jgi:hypothetical protein